MPEIEFDVDPNVVVGFAERVYRAADTIASLDTVARGRERHVAFFEALYVLIYFCGQYVGNELNETDRMTHQEIESLIADLAIGLLGHGLQRELTVRPHDPGYEVQFREHHAALTQRIPFYLQFQPFQAAETLTADLFWNFGKQVARGLSRAEDLFLIQGLWLTAASEALELNPIEFGRRLARQTPAAC